jgi:hypothetical protein
VITRLEAITNYGVTPPLTYGRSATKNCWWVVNFIGDEENTCAAVNGDLCIQINTDTGFDTSYLTNLYNCLGTVKSSNNNKLELFYFYPFAVKTRKAVVTKLPNQTSTKMISKKLYGSSNFTVIKLFEKNNIESYIKKSTVSEQISKIMKTPSTEVTNKESSMAYKTGDKTKSVVIKYVWYNDITYYLLLFPNYDIRDLFYDCLTKTTTDLKYGFLRKCVSTAKLENYCIVLSTFIEALQQPKVLVGVIVEHMLIHLADFMTLLSWG